MMVAAVPFAKLKPADAAAAVIFTDDKRFLLQHRDDIPDIFFPDHWGCFGGALEPAESPDQALIRELQEELGLALTRRDIRWFFRTSFDFSFAGQPVIDRNFFEVIISARDVDAMSLTEGQGLRLFTIDEILTGTKLVPYDYFAIWLYIREVATIRTGIGHA